MTIIDFNSPDCLRELQEFVDQCSMPSFDRSRGEYLDLQQSTMLTDSVYHNQLLHLVSQVLKLPGPTDRNGVESKWLGIEFHPCLIPRQDSMTPMELDHSTLEVMHHMLTSIARRAERLQVIARPDIISYLLSIPHLDQLEVKQFHIFQFTRLSDLEYLKLGNIIQGNVQLQDLSLHLPFDMVPPEFLDALANSTHVKKLSLRLVGQHLHREQAQSSLLGGNGVFARLLRNPQNQLRSLNFRSMGMTDNDFIALVQLLPAKVEFLDLLGNKIQATGILEFSRQLPRMQSLKVIFLGRNHWHYCEDDLNICGEALLQGIMQNTSIEYFDWVCPMGLDMPQSLLLWYYLFLNNAGRRILIGNTPSQPIPDGLWPFILAHRKYRLDVCDIIYLGPNMDPNAIVIYFFLRQCPWILERAGRSSNGPLSAVYSCSKYSPGSGNI